MRIIGIDFGDARIGLAASDAGETLATAQGTIKVSGMNDAVEKVSAKVKELGGEKIVIGMPKNMDGSLSFRAERTKRFAELIKEKTGLAVEFFDERLTTVEAMQYLNITDYKSGRRKNVIDTLSAQIILQAYLDAKKNA
ncbi:MAG TPA: Holliday junction resolvase RuvX [Bacillota bacterium]|nr:Holliday junction resolvase RuvX [Bacillota bacterium]HOK68132.1 Holliday junction resolvase RuvX [Bacillota bacterium]HPP84434.1 Holliday junction resolvase RuvX [Bacillota bacterium]